MDGRGPADSNGFLVRDVELSATLKPILLGWAARENRNILSHDEGTSEGSDDGSEWSSSVASVSFLPGLS